jgi:CO/xanthine dehydrogenase Mo-binding subunit
MRLKLINHEPSRQVLPVVAALSAVAALSSCGQPMAKGRGRGVAFHLSFEVPVTEVVEITVKVLEGGEAIPRIGEAGTPPAASALANAIFPATGQRSRELPLRQPITFV